jgi:hypothetical protein
MPLRAQDLVKARNIGGIDGFRNMKFALVFGTRTQMTDRPDAIDGPSFGDAFVNG